jgi:hypothetical protein
MAAYKIVYHLLLFPSPSYCSGQTGCFFACSVALAFRPPLIDTGDIDGCS